MNPYTPPSAEADPRRGLPRDRTCCLICGNHFSRHKTLLPIYRCVCCGQRTATKPNAIHSFIVIAPILFGSWWLWRTIRQDPVKMLDYGYWITAPFALLWLAPMIVAAFTGRPHPIRDGWGGWLSAAGIEHNRHKFHLHNGG